MNQTRDESNMVLGINWYELDRIGSFQDETQAPHERKLGHHETWGIAKSDSLGSNQREESA